ncbi:DUF3857 domain-containing protein [Flavobacterium sp. Sd200]|uniref:DUF3857 domain-containing protein n=1 Tax=Flavobacterium sp. Sd200 TaxID=2692211 RepID=UPI00136FD749|nr:DUF3857 domain-containing protein [Flavobacterium sp. Sd200]MXN91049.1 DUF3857 domain-containing protein [Flavobacterium sp. Sd200]
MFLRITTLLLTLMALPMCAQQNYSFASIPENLIENANAVIRLDQTNITITSRKSMTVKTTSAVTVLNKLGLTYMDDREYFDKSTNIKSIEAIVYDQNGIQIKKIKRKDFKEVAVSEGSITDNKMLYLDYTPVQYPFTLVFTSETETSNTAFIPQWYPAKGTFVSTQKSVRTVTYPPDLGFKFKDYNFGEIVLNKQQTGNSLSLSAENIPALRNEDYSPSFNKIMPHVLFGLEKFHLEGVDGEATTWETFGAWEYDALLSGTDELSIDTQNKIKGLVGNETDLLKKAKIVYKYVQEKTRYVSIQLGIGGFKPMNAKDVDRLGYGDCKALSNYTRALLKVVDVPSYYAEVYSGKKQRDFTSDFVSVQGDHVILAIPYNSGYIWLECTNQSAPFGFQGNFTDNRLVLLVKPGKGELVRTHVYQTKGNSQISKGTYTITDNGAMSGDVKIVSKGLQYDDKYHFEKESPDELDKIYKSRFSNINNLKLKKTGVQNNSDSQEFTEDIALEAQSYCNNSGNRLIFAINAYNQSSLIPQRYRNRKMPFEISTGFYDQDEITINLPQGFKMEAKPENTTITDKFGEYKTEYVIVSPTQMLYKRTLQINEGSYASSEYENYRLFREKIARNDNAKVVLVKN